MGCALGLLDTSVNIAFPAITRAFDRPIADIQWVVISYVLTYTSLMLICGRIGDMFGHARVFRFGLVASIAALLCCAAAPSFGWLLACRIFQGVGTALLLSCGAALATGLYDEARRGRALGSYVMSMAIGTTLGPWLGGMLVAVWDWPAVFWFRVPVALAALLLLRGPTRSPAPDRQVRFDALGALLLVVSLVAVLLTINRVRELVALPLGAVALAALAAFWWQEKRAAQPILDVRIFLRPGFALVNLANSMVNLAAFSVWLLVPYFLVRETGLSLVESGGVLATAAVGAVVASPLGGRLIGRVSARVLALTGALLIGAGLLLVAAWSHGADTAQLIAALGVQGFGIGLFQLAYTDIVTAALPRADRGVAGSLALVTRTLGTLGAASIVILVFQVLDAEAGFLPAFQRTFSLAAIPAFVVAVALALRRSIGAVRL